MAIQTTRENFRTFASGEVVSGATSDVVEIISDTDTSISIMIYPTGTAKVQFSVSPFSSFENDTARWTDWSIGEVTEDSGDILIGNISGLRVVSITEACAFEVMW